MRQWKDNRYSEYREEDRVSDKVSVIIPVYNSEEYMDKCIISVLNQTYNNIEVILVNDGSTDNSLSKCKEWERKDGRIVILDKVNEGPGFARNAGVSIATGKYISFVDSDDWIEEDYIEMMYKELINNNGDMSVCDIYYYDMLSMKETVSAIRFNKKVDSFVNNRSVINKVRTFAWGKLFVSDLFGEDTLFSGDMFEDVAFSAWMAYKSNAIVHVDKPLYHYVRNRNNSSIQNIDAVMDLPKCFKELYNKFEDCGQKAMLEVKKIIVGQLRFAFRKWWSDETGVKNRLLEIQNSAAECFPELKDLSDRTVYGSNDDIKRAINCAFPLEKQICDSYDKADYVICSETQMQFNKYSNVHGKIIILPDYLYTKETELDLWEAAEYIMENI